MRERGRELEDREGQRGKERWTRRMTKRMIWRSKKGESLRDEVRSWGEKEKEEEEKRAAVGPRRRRDAENEEESGGRRRHAGEAGVAAAVHTSRYEQRPPSPGSPNASGKVEETNDKVATPTASWRGRRSALCACDLDGRSGRGDAAGGIRDIRGKPRGIRAGCFLIFEAADRVMDVRGRPKLMVDDY